ncbi:MULTISPECIES: hypothetical protein [Methylobacter]
MWKIYNHLLATQEKVVLVKYYKCKRDSTQFIELSISSFERETDKKYPFYQTINGEKRYFAYCPGCDNPINIINLYSDKRFEEDGSKQKIHGRHYPHGPSDFESYDEERYTTCPFAKPSSFSGNTKRGNGKEANDLINLIIDHADTLYSFARSISGINISEPLFGKMLKNFKESEGVFFRHVTKFNLPYAFLYMSHNQSLYYQFIYEYDKNGIAKAITENSKHFNIVKNQIVPKSKTNQSKSIDMYFTDHKVSSKDDEPEHRMTLVIKEECDGENNNICEKIIIFDNYMFYKTVNKNQRVRDTAKGIMK